MFDSFECEVMSVAEMAKIYLSDQNCLPPKSQGSLCKILKYRVKGDNLFNLKTLGIRDVK